MTTAALDHLEKHLGSVSSVWSSRIGSSIRTLRFDERPVAGASTYATLGLSEQGLRGADGEPIHEELVLAALNQFDSDALGHFLLSLADSLVALQDPFAYGDVLGPSDVIIPDSTLRAVYGAEPQPFDGAFGNAEVDGQPIVWVWVVPITASEASYIQSNGAPAFESLVESERPDLFDLARAAIV